MADPEAERIRIMIAADWVSGVRPRGPDGKRLLTGFTLWAAAAAYAWATHESYLGLWGWGVALVVVIVVGAWGDRRAARKRGWISPMRRAEQIANEARNRSAVGQASVSSPGNASTSPASNEATCADCGHHFERGVTEAVSSA